MGSTPLGKTNVFFGPDPTVTVSRRLSWRSSTTLPPLTTAMRRILATRASTLEGVMVHRLDDLWKKRLGSLELAKIQIRPLQDVEGLRLLNASFHCDDVELENLSGLLRVIRKGHPRSH